MGASVWSPGSTITIDSASLLALFQIRGGWCGTAGGTADAIVLTPSSVLAAYAAGQQFSWISSGPNTGAVTVAISGLAPVALTKEDAIALTAEDIPGVSVITATYDGTRLVLMEVASVNKSLFTAAGDMVVSTAAGAPARIPATASVAAHATTMNPWVARSITLTGGIVTFTDIADAPYVGAVSWLRMNDAHIWTNGAIFRMPGLVNYTAASEDWLRIEALTVSTFNVSIFKADGTAVVASASTLPQNYLSGLILSNGTDATNDFNIGIGRARDSTNTVDLFLSAAMGKQLDVAWAAGGTTGAPAGGRMSPGAITNTTYFVFLIRKDSDGSIDSGFDVSPTAPTMPVGYTYFRRIGAFRRIGGVNQGILQYGDYFKLKVPVRDINTTNPGTARVALQLSNVPFGVKFLVDAYVDVVNTTSGAIYGLLTEWDSTDTVPSVALYNFSNPLAAGSLGQASCVKVWTDGGAIAASIACRISASGAADRVQVYINGWMDLRGKDGTI